MSTLKLEHIAHIDNAGPDISIDSSGHLNIVNGNLQMGGVTMLDASTGSLNATGIVTAVGGNTNNTDDAAVFKGTGTEHIKLLLDTSSTGGHRASVALESNSNEVNIATTGSDEMRFSTANTSDALFIKSDGNVGIGTASPEYALHLARTGSNYIQIDNDQQSVTGFLGVATDHLWLGTSTNHQLKFYANSDIKMVIDTNGKVGIGTVSPEVKLEVNGGADGSVVFAGRSDGGNGNNRRFNLIAYADGGGANYGGGLKIQTRDSVNVFSDAITVQSNGNVGIGTDSPTHKLQVNGTAADGTELFHILSNGNVADGGYHWMSSAIASSQTTNANIVHMIGRELASKNAGYFGFHYAGDHSDDNFITLGGYAADQLLNIKMNGNVGIGTTSPDFTVDVTHQATGQTDVMRLKGHTGNAFVRFQDNDSSADWTFGSDDGSGAGAGALIAYDRNNSAYRFVINSSGNVGIGTTSPTEKLHVLGNILATGVVNASSDISLKDNITPIPNAIDKVLQIRGVTFNRNDIEDNPRQAGVIAQEVEKVLPEVVSEDKDGIKSVAYGNMVGLLIEAIKEQQGQINMLKEKLENK